MLDPQLPGLPLNGGPGSSAASGEWLSRRQQAVLSATATLTDLLAEFAFFSHALWFTYGGLDLDPIDDFLSTRDCASPALMQLPTSIFQGMGHWQGLELDSALWICPREVWPSLYTFLRMVGGLHPQHTWQAVCQEGVPVLDVLHVLRYPERPAVTVPVAVFGVDGNRGQAIVQPVSAAVVPVIRRPVQAKTAAVMQAAMAGDVRAHVHAQPSFDEAVSAMQEKLRANQDVPSATD